MGTFQIKVKEVVISSEEYESVVNQLNDYKKNEDFIKNSYKNIEKLFRKFGEFGIQISNHSDDFLDPENEIKIFRNGLEDRITVQINNKKQ